MLSEKAECPPQNGRAVCAKWWDTPRKAAGYLAKRKGMAYVAPLSFDGGDFLRVFLLTDFIFSATIEKEDSIERAIAEWSVL